MKYMAPKSSTAKANRLQLNSVFKRCIKSNTQSDIHVGVSVCVTVKDSSDTPRVQSTWQRVCFVFPHNPKTVQFQSSSQPQKERQLETLGFTTDPHNSLRSSGWEIHTSTGLFVLAAQTPETRLVLYHELATVTWTLQCDVMLRVKLACLSSTDQKTL